MNNKGFTLVELVIVLVILAILVGIALPTFMGVRDRAYRAEALQILDELKVVSWAHNLENGGTPGTDESWPLDADLDTPDTTNWAFVVEAERGADIAHLDCTTANCLNISATGQADADGAGVIHLYLDLNGEATVE